MRRAAAPRAAAWSTPSTTCATPTTATGAPTTRQLDVLVPAADALITLTPGAAAEIERRWGRRGHRGAAPARRRPADHGRAEACRVAAPPGPADPFRVGLHVKSLRANAWTRCALLPTLVETVADLPGAVLQVNGHRDVLEPGGPRYDGGLADGAARARPTRGLLRAAGARLPSRRRPVGVPAGLDVSVLPYRFGTHSGWLEACRDLGTTVLAPTCGYFAEQGPVLTYTHDEDRFDADSLAAARAPRPRRATALGCHLDERRRQRAGIAAAHDAVYAAALQQAGQGPRCASA